MMVIDFTTLLLPNTTFNSATMKAVVRLLKYNALENQQLRQYLIHVEAGA